MLGTTNGIYLSHPLRIAYVKHHTFLTLSYIDFPIKLHNILENQSKFQLDAKKFSV